MPGWVGVSLVVRRYSSHANEENSAQVTARTPSTTTDAALTCRRLDYENADDARTLIDLLDAYARDPMGGGAPLDQGTRRRLADVLASTPNALSFVAEHGRRAVGLANCFTSVSTFAARPIVNFHDIYVDPSVRGVGVGKLLMSTVEAAAREMGACKLTLEVLEGNERARRVYAGYGFAGYALDETTGHALFWEKKLG